MSRPPKPIDWNLVENLLMAGCKGTEIAPHFDMNVETFYDRVLQNYSIGFTELCAEKRGRGESVLRAKQYQKATKDNGDTTMLIWLGKCRLDQKEYQGSDAPSNVENLEIKDQFYKAMQKIEDMQKEINDLKSKTSQELQRSDTPVQSVDRGS